MMVCVPSPPSNLVRRNTNYMLMGDLFLGSWPYCQQQEASAPHPHALTMHYHSGACPFIQAYHGVTASPSQHAMPQESLRRQQQAMYSQVNSSTDVTQWTRPKSCAAGRSASCCAAKSHTTPRSDTCTLKEDKVVCSSHFTWVKSPPPLAPATLPHYLKRQQ